MLQVADIQISGNTNASPLAQNLAAALEKACSETASPAPLIRAMPGMSGQRYRVLINELIRRTSHPRYLEVGSWMGSTLCSAIHENAVYAVAIDNWSEFGGPMGTFFKHLSETVTAQTRVSVINSDFRNVRYSTIGKFNIYLFDGPHTSQDQYDGVVMALEALDDEFILIVDDWNWKNVRDATIQAIKDRGLEILYRVDVRSTLNDTHPGEQGLPTDQNSDWHNGYFFAVLRK